MDECREYVKPADIEGYAMAGRIAAVEILMCGESRERVVVKLNTGEILCTNCLDVDEARACKKIIEFYMSVKLVR